MVTLNNTYDEMIGALGTPVEEKMDGSLRVLLYNSPSMTLADLYYLQNNRLVVQSFGYYTEPKSMQEYMSTLGKPEYSVRRYAGNTEDSLTTIVHVWPAAGKSVVTTGTDQRSVIREDQFAPTTLQQYLATWGKDLVGHEQVQLATASSIQPVVIQNTTQYSNTPLWTWIGVTLILFVVVGTFAMKRTRVGNRGM